MPRQKCKVVIVSIHAPALPNTLPTIISLNPSTASSTLSGINTPFPPASPTSTQANEIQVTFINVGNLTAGIDIPEVGFKLDLMPSGSETCRLLDIDPNKAYSLKFSFYDSFQVVVERYAIRRSSYKSKLILLLDTCNSHYLHDGMSIDTRPLMDVREDYKEIDRYPYYIPSLQRFETILG